jgi:hypothetical protein
LIITIPRPPVLHYCNATVNLQVEELATYRVGAPECNLTITGKNYVHRAERAGEAVARVDLGRLVICGIGSALYDLWTIHFVEAPAVALIIIF